MRQRSPLVSLIMPVWAPRPDWLRAAVESALGQTGCAVELVVVDDGCESPVADLLAGLEDPRMRIVRVPHGGLSRARNAGIEVARGDWFRFVDCDDVIVAESTERLLAVTDGDERLIAYGATAVCDQELRPLSTVSSGLQGWVAEQCLLNRFDTTIHSLLFPRSVVEEIGPWEPTIEASQDWDYALRAFERAQVCGDRRIATLYRTHEGMKSRNVREGIRGYRMVVDRYFERHPEQRGGTLERRANAGFHLFAAAQSATALHEYGRALAHAGRALSIDPRASIVALRRHGGMRLHSAIGRFVRRLTD